MRGFYLFFCPSWEATRELHDGLEREGIKRAKKRRGLYSPLRVACLPPSPSLHSFSCAFFNYHFFPPCSFFRSGIGLGFYSEIKWNKLSPFESNFASTTQPDIRMMIQGRIQDLLFIKRRVNLTSFSTRNLLFISRKFHFPRREVQMAVIAWSHGLRACAAGLHADARTFKFPPNTIGGEVRK